MYPTLYHFLQKALGIEIPFFMLFNTFGFFLAMAFLTAGIVIHKEFKRYEKNGLLHPVSETFIIGKQPQLLEILINGIIGFLLGFKLVYILLNFSDFLLHKEGYIVSGDGNVLGGIVVAIISAAYYYYKRKKVALPKSKTITENIFPHQRVNDLVVLAAIFGIIGAKLFTHIENWDSFIQNPIREFFSFSGLTFYGGLIVAAAALLIYGKMKKIPPLRLCDVTAPALILAYAVGRMGCHFSGDGDWGIPNLADKPSFLPDWLWALNYPNNVAKEGVRIADCVGEFCYQLVPPVYPTSVYEIFMCTVIFGILWFLRKKLNIAGMLFAIYLIFNGIERFFIEFIRVNPKYDFLGFSTSQAQMIAIGLILTGVVMGSLVYFFRTKNQEPRIKTL